MKTRTHTHKPSERNAKKVGDKREQNRSEMS